MSIAEHAEVVERPWFRQPFVWLVIGIPLSSVIVGMVMLWLSIASFDGMVADDYYKRGLQINRVLVRERAALAAQLHGTLLVHAHESRLQLRSGDSGFVLPAQVQVHLSYATRAGQDREFTMTRGAGDDEYRGPALQLPPGHWYVYVSGDADANAIVATHSREKGRIDGDTAGAWRLSGTLSTPGEGVVAMSPTAAGR